MKKKKIMALLMAMSIAAVSPSMFTSPMIVHAGSGTGDTTDSIIQENDKDLETNSDTININNGSIGTNFGIIGTTNGSIDTNESQINLNKSTVTTNKGIITDNEGTVKNNEATVWTNNGTVTTNKGDINDNNKTVKDNYGTIANNNDYVMNNYAEGTVTTNNATVGGNEGTVVTNNGKISGNEGTVTTNSDAATIGTNSGTVTTNSGTIQFNGGVVESNSGTIENNNENGTVVLNSGSVTITANRNDIETQVKNKVFENLGTVIVNDEETKLEMTRYFGISMINSTEEGTNTLGLDSVEGKTTYTYKLRDGYSVDGDVLLKAGGNYSLSTLTDWSTRETTVGDETYYIIKDGDQIYITGVIQFQGKWYKVTIPESGGEVTVEEVTEAATEESSDSSSPAAVVSKPSVNLDVLAHAKAGTKVDAASLKLGDTGYTVKSYMDALFAIRDIKDGSIPVGYTFSGLLDKSTTSQTFIDTLSSLETLDTVYLDTKTVESKATDQFGNVIYSYGKIEGMTSDSVVMMMGVTKTGDIEMTQAYLDESTGNVASIFKKDIVVMTPVAVIPVN